MGGGYEQMRDAWLEADRLGFDTAWLHDHLLNQNDIALPEDEGWTVLTALLVQSTRIRGGLMVTANTFRHPGLLAKMVTTLDIISGGRVEVGLGAGWFEAEHRQYGLDLPPIGERMRRLEESCQILEALWTEKRATFEGHVLRGARRVPRARSRCSGRIRRSRSARAASRSASASPRATRTRGTWRARRPRSSVASRRCSTATAERSAGSRRTSSARSSSCRRRWRATSSPARASSSRPAPRT